MTNDATDDDDDKRPAPINRGNNEMKLRKNRVNIVRPENFTNGAKNRVEENDHNQLLHRARDNNIVEINVIDENQQQSNIEQVKVIASNIIIDNETVKSYQSPKVPRWDQRKIKELLENSRVRSLAKLNENHKKEIFETEDSVKLSQLPRFNGISKAIEAIVSDITKRNEKFSQVLQENLKKQREEFQTIFNEELLTVTDLKKYETALKELQLILKTKNEKCEEAENRPIPTRTAFKEVAGILRNFIAVRNNCLSKCFTADFRKNKVGDNYTNLLCQFERNKSLLRCIRQKRTPNKLDSRVLSVSTKISEKVLNQLRHQTKKILTKKSCTTWKQLNNKIRRYDSIIEIHKKNIAQMKVCVVDKRRKIINSTNNNKEIDEQIKQHTEELKNAEIDFEKKTMETKSYTEKRLIVTQKKNILEDIRSSYQKDLLALDSLKEKLKEWKEKERNIDYLYEEVANITTKIQTSQDKWQELEKLQLQMKEEIRLKNGIMLRHEEIQQEIQSEKIRCRKQYSEYASQLENANYQKQRLKQRLKSITNQGQNYQRYRNSIGNQGLTFVQ